MAKAATSKIRLAAARAHYSWQTAIIGSFIWSVIIFGSIALNLKYLAQFADSDQIRFISLYFAIGALLAFAPSFWLARLITPAPGLLRIVAFIILLALGTAATTAMVLALEYRAYFVQWHGETFSKLWFWQQLFTTAGAVFQYVVIGLRLYVPLGLIGLVAISLWAGRLTR